MKNFRSGQPIISDFPYPFPCGFVSLAALPKLTSPKFGHTFPEYHKGRKICWHRVVSKEAPDYLLQPLPLLGYGMVSTPAQFLPDLPEFCSHAVASGLPFKLENSPARFAADERETKKVEGLRFAETASFAVMHRETAELDQAGLLRVKRQRELLKPLSHNVEKPTRGGLELESDHQIVRKARDDHVARGFVPSPALCPKVEDVVKVNVGKQR